MLVTRAFRLSVSPGVRVRLQRVPTYGLLCSQPRFFSQKTVLRPEPVLEERVVLPEEEADELFKEEQENELPENDMAEEEQDEKEEEDEVTDIFDPNEDARLEEERDVFKRTVFSTPGAKLQQHMVNNGIKPENAARYVR